MQISFLTTYAPFVGEKKLIQTVAAKSLSLIPDSEVIVLGDSEGTEQICTRFGFKHLKDVKTGIDIGVKNSNGIVLSDAFEKATPIVSGKIVIYVNGDVILCPHKDITQIFDGLIANMNEDFVGIIRRKNVPQGESDRLKNYNETQLHQIVVEKSSKWPEIVHGIDCFIWGREKFINQPMPNFLVNGFRWDIWLGNDFRKRGNYFDFSSVMSLVHLYHKTSHNVIDSSSTIHNKSAIKHIPEKVPLVNKYKIPVIRREKVTPKKSVDISVIMIVLNGMPFIKYSIKALYEYVKEIIIVEGCVKNCKFAANPDGSSTDGTVAFIKNYPDPENKIKLIQGMWEEKCDMQDEALEKVTGDYVWLVDSDEIYKKKDIEAILQLLSNDSEITEVRIRGYSFWKDINYYVQSDKFVHPVWAFRRLFKFYPGSTFIQHRPPRLMWPDGKYTDKGKIFLADQSDELDIKMYHYCYTSPSQVRQKKIYYHNLNWDKQWNCDIMKWLNDLYFEWTVENRESIEKTYPVWMVDKMSKTQLFEDGHPEVMNEYIKNLTEPHKITHKETTLAIVIPAKYIPNKTSFITPESYAQQVGLIVHDVGDNIKPHKHLEKNVDSCVTGEVLFVKEGIIKVRFYIDKECVDSVDLSKGDTIILTEVAHSIEIIQKAVLLEVKQGPFVIGKDKEFI